MYFYQLNLQAPQVIGHFTINVTAGVASEVFYVCLYNSSGSSLLWSANIAVASNGTTSGTATQYPAPAGTYILTYEETGGASAATLTSLTATGAVENILNNKGSRIGTAGNTISGGNCQGTAGTLTTASTVNPVMILLEP